MDGQPSGNGRTEAVGQRAILVILIAVVLGMGLRLRQYAAQHSYWQDEAMLVLNIFEKDSSELMGPLDSAQAAPPGFLLAQRGAYLLLGRSEAAMRLLPLLCSLVALGLLAGLAWRLFRESAPWAAAFVVILFACSDKIIWHASEAKQYSVDVMFALILLWIALGLDKSWSATRRMLLLSIVAAIGVWFSHPSVFMFGGISLSLLPGLIREHRGRGGAVWIAANAVFLISFLALYMVSIHDQEATFLYEYWKAEFIDYSRPLAIPAWFLREFTSLCNYPLDLGGPVLMPLVVLGGWAMLHTGRGRLLAALALPAALVLLAAALHRYPFGGSRLTVFLSSAVFLLAGVGTVTLGRLLEVRVGRAWLVTPAYLLMIALTYAGIYIITPSARGNIEPVVHYIADHWKPGDVVYANKPAEFRVYWGGAPLRETTDLGRDVPAGRFWLALSYTERHRKQNIDRLEQIVEPEADRRDLFIVPGGSAMLFEGLPDPHSTTDPAAPPG